MIFWRRKKTNMKLWDEKRQTWPIYQLGKNIKLFMFYILNILYIASQNSISHFVRIISQISKN